MRIKTDNLIYPELSYKLVGLLYDIHNDLGRYCNEKQYCDALEQVLIKNNIRYKRESVIETELEIKKRNRVDFIINNDIILELKAKRLLERADYYQLQRYLQSAGFKLGILVNFRDRHLKPRRVINNKI